MIVVKSSNFAMFSNKVDVLRLVTVRNIENATFGCWSVKLVVR